jgi:hypothetical protein
MPIGCICNVLKENQGLIQMVKYINPELTSNSFKRLSSRNMVGKSHLERTSALMYFLSIDATCKLLSVNCLDLNPTTPEGKRNRKFVELEFTKLTLLGKCEDNIMQVLELGKITTGGTSPEKRISSNFLTVPLKKASEQEDAYFYPRRPSAPLLKMGLTATNMKWGIEYHENWQSNFPVILSEVKCPTPTLDLAIFICRDCKFDDDSSDLICALTKQLKKKFTKAISDYLTSKINKEKIIARHLKCPFVEQYKPFAKQWKSKQKSIVYEQMERSELIKHIIKLERLLINNNITV